MNQEKKAFNEYLYTMPMEAHGGKKYSSLCLEYITELVKNGIDISIFPEGAYVEEKRMCLHNVTDQALKNIAEELDKQYVDSYIELFPKGNVIFSDGNVVLTEDAQDSYYVNLYEQELKNRYTDIARQFVKRK